MQFATKFGFAAAAALLLTTSAAWAAGGSDESIIDSLKAKAGEALPKNVMEKSPDFEPRAAEPAPQAAPQAAPAASAPTGAPASQATRFPTGVKFPAVETQKLTTSRLPAASQGGAQNGFPDTKPAISEGGFPVKTVRELIDLEAKTALLKSKDRFDSLKAEKGGKGAGPSGGPQVSAPIAPPGPPPEVLDLLAVFGYGNVKFANIHYNGQSYNRLSNGGRFGPYTLASINDSCVLLTKEPQPQLQKNGKKSVAIITERHLCITETPTAQPAGRVFGPQPLSAVRLGDSFPRLRQAGPAVFQ